MEAIEVRNLRKTYGETVAVEDVSFTVEEGEIFGVLGPNGAGKTTTVETIAGLRVADAGRVRGGRGAGRGGRGEGTGGGGGGVGGGGGGPGGPPAARALREPVGVKWEDGARRARVRVGGALALSAPFSRDPADAGELMAQL